MAYDLRAERDNEVHNSTRIIAKLPFHDALSTAVGKNPQDPRCSTVLRVEASGIDADAPHTAIRGIGGGDGPGIVGHGGFDSAGVIGVGGQPHGTGILGLTGELTGEPMPAKGEHAGVRGFSKTGFGVDAASDQHIAVRATSTHSYAIFAIGWGGASPTIFARSDKHNAIEADSRNKDGILARSVLGAGVHGIANQSDGHLGNGPGVLGEAAYGIGVKGEGGEAGVQGHSDGRVGVYGHSRLGPGMRAASDEGNGLEAKGQRYAAILGENDGPFPQCVGVVGKSTIGMGGEFRGGAIGVFGQSNVGLGGEFQGGAAQIRLVPSDQIGSPTGNNHQKGELFLDQNADLFICVKGAPSPQWKRVNWSETGTKPFRRIHPVSSMENGKISVLSMSDLPIAADFFHEIFAMPDWNWRHGTDRGQAFA